MPTKVVDITLSTETAAVPEEQFNTVAVVGTSDTAPPNANFGESNLYSAADEVDNDYGSNADVTTASEVLESKGVSEWYVVVLEEIEVTAESLTDSALDTLANNPVLGDPTPTVDTGDLTFVAGTPDDGITSGVELNTDTGQYYSAETGAAIDYSYVDWTQLDNALEGLGVDLFFKADTNFDREHIGSLDNVVSWADGHEAAVVAMSVNGATVSDEQTAIDIAHDVGGYVSSGSLLHVAHKSGEEVAAEIIGQLANATPWFDPFYDGDGYSFSTDYYRDVNVGDPSSAGTFEGGDQANQEGPTNVIINKAGTTVLSNSLSTAGASSSYQFFDVRRTEDYAQAQVESALTSLRLNQDRIPFTKEGRALISDAIRGAFRGDVGGPNDPFSSVSVYVPKVGTLTDTDKANRVWSGITIDATLSGNVHEFSLEMNIGV